MIRHLRFSVALTASILTLFLSAQEYTPLMAEGEIPADFVGRASEKARMAQSAEYAHGAKTQKEFKAKQAFLLRASFMLDDLLMSGHVLFGDEVSEYVNEVGSEVLKHDPVLQDRLRFYVVKSDEVNAFATEGGMIFVTLGLISQLQNEAQLAYVLCHEIAHFEERHLISEVLKESRMRADRRAYANGDEVIDALSEFSRENELAADSLGYIRYKALDYDLETVMSVFDVLQFSHLPMDEKRFDFGHILDGEFEFPAHLSLDTLVAIDFRQDHDDSNSSHPNVGTRRGRMRSINNDASSQGALFVIGEQRFMDIRDRCRLETIRLGLRDREYVDVIYDLNILLDESPSNRYLQKSMAKALYGVAKYKLVNRRKNPFDDYDEFEGALSSAYYAFEQLGKEQMLLVALSYAHRYLEEFTDDEHVGLLMDDLTGELAALEDLDLPTLLSKVQQTTEVTSDTTQMASPMAGEGKVEESEVDMDSMSKYEKLKALQKEVESEEKEREYVEEDSYYQLLTAAVEDPDFIADLKAKKDRMGSEKEHISDDRSGRRSKKEAKRSEAHVGAEKVVFVDPQYYAVESRKGLRRMRSENREYKFYSQIAKVAEKAELDYEIVTPKFGNNNNTTTFNDLVTFKDWIRERLSHDDYRTADWHIVSSEREYVKGIAARYGTDDFILNGVVLLKDAPPLSAINILYGVFLYPLLPVIVYYSVKPSYDTVYYCVAFDVDDDRVMFERSYEIGSKGNQGDINSFMYDSFNEMKKQADQ